MIKEELDIAYRFSETPRKMIKKRVMIYNNSGLIKKHSVEMSVPEGDAARAFTELKKFLFICGVTSETLAPSMPVDKIWHQFILFTGDYMRFCNRHFNQMIHHTPEISVSHKVQKIKKAYSRTYDIAVHEFGELDPDYWMEPSMAAFMDCDDGTVTAKCSSKCSGK